MDICLFCNGFYSLLFRLHCGWSLSSAEIGLANLINSHDHLIYLAYIRFHALAYYCRINLAICRFSLPVISQKIFLAELIVVVRRKSYRTGWEKSLCKVVSCILVICQSHVCKCCVGSEYAFCDFRLDSCCCVSH